MAFHFVSNTFHLAVGIISQNRVMRVYSRDIQ
jgi:hypothetical protein